MSHAIRPAPIAIDQAQLDDLKARLALTRWPDREVVGDWSQGAPLSRMLALTEYWRTAYDWRRCETMLNGMNPSKTSLDGLGIHFLHIRSPHENALPMVMTHGWPGSVVEFHKTVAPLTEPTKHGGKAEDAFHLVIPSLPGYGFSDRPTSTGWKVSRIAQAWSELMLRLGYDRYVAQGGDWGSAVTSSMGRQQVKGLAAIHLNMVTVGPPRGQTEFDDDEKSVLAVLKNYRRWETGYSGQQATRPQTLGYGLADSPAGQAAWIYEKFHAWTDCRGDPESVLSRDELLDNIMLYWLPNAATSSARLYWESFREMNGDPVPVPTAVTVFPKEISRPPRKWAEPAFPAIYYWNEVAHGGHFGAFEQPKIFVNEVRAAFRSQR